MNLTVADRSGVLALELAPLTLAARLALPQDQAACLGEHLAADLARLLEDIDGLQLTVLAAHFDPAELLRPGWPLHAALADLARRTPGHGQAARVLAIGQDNGRLPAALSPDAGAVGGALRVLPFVLDGPPERCRGACERMETHLLDHGMAGAAAALAAQDGFGARIEHARYLSLHDLLALTAMQYRHAGLAPLWPLLETALLAPHEEAWLDAPPEPLLHYAAGRVRLAAFDRAAWSACGFAPPGLDAAAVERAWRRFRQRQQQIGAVLAAHGLAVETVEVGGGDPRQVLG